MRLATKRNGSPDGALVLVNSDVTCAVEAGGIADTLQSAIEHWDQIEAPLADLAAKLDSGEVGEAIGRGDLMAPLPRSWQWLDASAFPSHGRLMEKALNLPPLETENPLMYQGISSLFYDGHEDVPFPSMADGIDFEGEFGVITDAVPMGVTPEAALSHVRLIVLLNDWSLRAMAAAEFKTGFGWVRAKPACSMAPIALTPDEFAGGWSGGRLSATLRVFWNEKPFGAVPTDAMEYHFGELIAHAAYSRNLCAGTIIGSGTVSTANARGVGSCCIAERRAIEIIDGGEALTPFLSFGDRIRMEAVTPEGQGLPFGKLDQTIRQA